MFIGPLLGSTAASSPLSLVMVLMGGALLRLGSALLVHFGLSIIHGKRISPLHRART
jgi:hypothetical protein